MTDMLNHTAMLMFHGESATVRNVPHIKLHWHYPRYLHPK